MHRILTGLVLMMSAAGLVSAGQGQPAPKKADIIRQLQNDFEDARTRLQKDDSGQATRAAQRGIVEGIDKLLDEQDPDNSPPNPPPGAPPMQPPSDGSTTQPPADGNTTPKNKPAPQPQAKQQAKPGAQSAPELRRVPEGKLLPPSRVEMDGPWQSLRHMRREAVDAVGRERFPRGYEELLRAYYRSLAAGRSED